MRLHFGGDSNGSKGHESNRGRLSSKRARFIRRRLIDKFDTFICAGK